MSENTQQTPSRKSLHQTAKKKQHNQGKKTRMKLWKKITLSILSVFTLIIVGAVGLFAFYVSSAPSFTEEQLMGTVSSTIYDRNGQELLKLGTENRILIDANNIPQLLEDAVLSVEDRRFYDHLGVDPIRIIGALLVNAQSGDLSQGGSTISQQLIKLSVFSTTEADRTLKRKAQEAWLALDLERKYTKKQILAFYMNKVYLANNTYGFATAAKYYFNKDAHELTLPQAALLAGMPQAPVTYDPYVDPVAAKDRRDIVLKTMLDNNKITQQQYDEAVASSVTDGLVDATQHAQSNDNILLVDSYLQQVVKEVEEKTGLNPYTDGLQIYTNIDVAAQKELKNLFDSTDAIDWVNNDIQAGMAVVEPSTGAIVALMGGRNISVQMGYNRATQLNRSSGSTIKPLLDYAPAIELLGYSTGTTLVDEKTTFSDGTPLNNFDFAYRGKMTLREALVESRNTTAYKALMAVGLDDAYTFLKKLGFRVYYDDAVEGLVENHSIGVSSNPLQLAAAYAAFANGGTYYKPFAVNRVVTMDGKAYDFNGEGARAMKDSTAYMITDVLKGVPKTNKANISGLNHAGKTGSTNYTDEQLQQVTGGVSVDYASMDSWYAGYTPHYSIAVWVGYDQPFEYKHYLDWTEAQYAQQLYREAMIYFSEQVANDDWQRPSSVEEATIVKYSDPLTLANFFTFNRVTELFSVGTVPQRVSNEVPKPGAPSNLQAVYHSDSRTIELSWSASPTNGAVYDIKVGDQTLSTSELKQTIRVPASARGLFTITVMARVSNQVSDSIITTVQLEPESSSSSSSESSSSGESSSNDTTGQPNSNPNEPPANQAPNQPNTSQNP